MVGQHGCDKLAASVFGPTGARYVKDVVGARYATYASLLSRRHGLEGYAHMLHMHCVRVRVRLCIRTRWQGKW